MRNLSLQRRYLVNAYEVEAGFGVIAGNTVWSMPERLECEVLQKARYINTLTFTFYRFLTQLSLQSWSIQCLWLHLSDKEKMVQFAEEERQVREENVRLQRKLQMEIERREQLCRHLSESESSLEMDDERCIRQSHIYQSWIYITYKISQNNLCTSREIFWGTCSHNGPWFTDCQMEMFSVVV